MPSTLGPLQLLPCQIFSCTACTSSGLCPAPHLHFMHATGSNPQSTSCSGEVQDLGQAGTCLFTVPKLIGWTSPKDPLWAPSLLQL